MISRQFWIKWNSTDVIMRKVEDAFGELELPDDALYGLQTARTISNMSFSGHSLSQYPVYIQSLASVKKAAALANSKTGVIDSAICTAIIGACDELIAGKHTEQFPVDAFHGGGSIGINMNINEVIAALAGEQISPANHVNASQSTADVCHTAIRIALIETFKPLEQHLLQVIQTLELKAKQLESVTTIARTCWQDGMRVSAGVVFQSTASALKRRIAAMSQAVEDIHRINLGGTVIGSGIGASTPYREAVVPILAEITGLPLQLRSDLYDAAQYPDDLGRLSSEVRLTSAVLVKLAKDLRLLSSGPETGLAELTLPAVQAGSSFFPGKVNPVIPETVIHCGLLINGHDSVIQSAVELGEVHLNLADGLMGTLLLDNMQMLSRTTVIFESRCLSGISVNEETCKRYADSFIPLIVDLKEAYGYEQVALWMKQYEPKQIREKFGRSEKHE
ncbi:lyase family protein [Paenibacillus alginolyticus]|uniref:Lyase family protein n=1 Tax=Paenibacillus alginolyticus TaxID=59839 RepID=A0ABT4G778_9BACL|nr:lyase family protein [Paenibacillus alginolyticus]MCY9692033.1 lyase family protein [Paenibacillus alginolyticus]